MPVGCESLSEATVPDEEPKIGDRSRAAFSAPNANAYIINSNPVPLPRRNRTLIVPEMNDRQGVQRASPCQSSCGVFVKSQSVVKM